MYKKSLFASGAKSFSTYKHKQGGACGSGCGSGAKSSNMDNYLLGLVKGVSRLSVKPKQKTKTSGKGLKLIR